MADCTIIDKLNYILETKDLIKTALETQDVEVLESDTFRKYSEYITEIRKVASVNGETGDIILKTINGQNLVEHTSMARGNSPILMKRTEVPLLIGAKATYFL